MDKAQRLGDCVEKVRSKNAGPFRLTIDIFCGTQDVYDRVGKALSTQQVADVLQVDAGSIKRYDIASLNVIKFSMPRPTVQGSLQDRDLHGASWAALLSDATLAAQSAAEVHDSI